MQARSVEFFESLTRNRQGQTILVVVHAGVIRGFVSHFFGLPYADNLKRKISHRYIGDFLFAGYQCVRYDELGKPSGSRRIGGLPDYQIDTSDISEIANLSGTARG
jgi:broad specificity phosphatase PhoE